MSASRSYLSLFFFAFFVFLPSARVEELKLKLGVEVESNLYLGLHPKDEIVAENNLGRLFNFGNTNRLALKLTARYGDRAEARANVELRNLNFSAVRDFTELENYNSALPVSVRVNELYIDFYSIFSWLDIRIGQQRIAWGTATVFNPTDNINPYNLENPLDFQERLGVPALKASVYIGEVATLTLVNVWMFTPPVLPVALFRDAASFDVSPLIPEGFKLGKFTSNEIIKKPEFSVENMQAAARLLFDFEGINFSASYYFGRVYIPVPSRIPVTDTGLKDLKQFLRCYKKTPVQEGCELNPTAKDVELIFPRIHVAGLDFATSLFGIGLWAEAALFIPVEAVKPKITAVDPISKKVIDKNPLTNKPLSVVTSFKKEPYFKLTAGLDYTFKGGWYINLQYLYGFFNEQTWDTLHHYWFLVFRKPFFGEKLLIQLTGGFELDATATSGEKGDGSKAGLGFLVQGEIQYHPLETGELTLGWVVSRGDRGTTFRMFQGLAQLYFRFKLEF